MIDRKTTTATIAATKFMGYPWNSPTEDAIVDISAHKNVTTPYPTTTRVFAAGVSYAMTDRRVLSTSKSEACMAIIHWILDLNTNYARSDSTRAIVRGYNGVKATLNKTCDNISSMKCSLVNLYFQL